MTDEELGVRRAIAYLRKEAAGLTRENGGDGFVQTRHSLMWVADMLAGEVEDVLRTPIASPPPRRDG